MKIGFDAKRYFHNQTGLGNYSRDLIRVLNTYYPDNEYILFNPKPTEKHQEYIQQHDNIKEINPTTSWQKKLKSFWRSYGITKECTKRNISVYHGLSGEIPVGINKKAKTVVTIHDLIFLRYPELYSWFDVKIHHRKFKYACENAYKIIAISEQTKRDIVDFLKINPEKIDVVYQGCSHIFKENYSSDELNRVQQQYNLPEKFVLNVGTIEARKNALQIVKAITNIDTTLVLIGRKTDYWKEIEKYAKENNITHKIKHLSNISQRDLAIIYQLATVMAYPSVFEGFGIPIIEALYSKTPVITTNSGVFPEAGGPNSMYINPENVEEMQVALEKLLSDDKLQFSMAENGWQYAQKFNDERIADHLMKVYHSL